MQILLSLKREQGDLGIYSPVGSAGPRRNAEANRTTENGRKPMAHNIINLGPKEEMLKAMIDKGGALHVAESSRYGLSRNRLAVPTILDNRPRNERCGRTEIHRCTTAKRLSTLSWHAPLGRKRLAEVCLKTFDRRTKGSRISCPKWWS